MTAEQYLVVRLKQRQPVSRTCNFRIRPSEDRPYWAERGLTSREFHLGQVL
jgi:hypothetical protein